MFSLSLPKNIDARFTVSVLSYKYDLNVSISITDIFKFLSKNRQTLTAIETQLLAQLGQSAEMQKFINALLLSSLGFSVPFVQIAPYEPTVFSSSIPSIMPTSEPTYWPTIVPSVFPSNIPTTGPSIFPSNIPTTGPSNIPTYVPTTGPSNIPTYVPTTGPSIYPSNIPTTGPSIFPSNIPTYVPTTGHSNIPTTGPSIFPSNIPTYVPIMVNNTQLSTTPTTSIECSPGNITLFIVAGILVGVVLSNLITLLRIFYIQMKKQRQLNEVKPLI